MSFNILGLIDEGASSDCYKIDSISTLRFDKDEPDPEDNYDYFDEADDESTSYSYVSMAQKQEVITFWRQTVRTAHRRWEQMGNRFRWLQNHHERQLYIWEKQVQNYGARKDKLQIVWDQTLAEFKLAIINKLIVHDIDIRRWAMAEARKVNLFDFKASSWWIWRFKTVNHIRSRKITKFVSQSYTRDTDKLLQSARNFVDCKNFV